MRRQYLFGGLALLLTLFGCAGSQKAVTLAPGGELVTMTASSFSFEPSLIRAHKGDRLMLAIENSSGKEHNFTLRDPAGMVLVSKDLPAHQILPVEVALARAGEYQFICDKPLHATFGMKGRVIVTE